MQVLMGKQYSHASISTRVKMKCYLLFFTKLTSQWSDNEIKVIWAQICFCIHRNPSYFFLKLKITPGLSKRDGQQIPCAPVELSFNINI